MTTSGLVLTLAASAAARARTLAMLAADPRVSLGEAVDLRLPIATEAASRAEAEALAETIRALEGVTFVDVVYVHFDEEVC